LQRSFAKAGALNQRPISWSLDAKFVVQLAIDTEAVLGYYPNSIEQFLGLPIRLRPSGYGNRLITEEGWIAVADPAPIEALQCSASLTPSDFPVSKHERAGSVGAG
jgi:hypothetical protein